MNKRIWIGLGVLTVLGGGAAFWWRAKPAAVTYREVAVRVGDLAVTIVSTGTVLPENRLEIKPPVAGRVEEVLVREGQKVTKGTLLAWMSSTERAALIDAARSEGPEELQKWETNYRATPVVAPINGTIILRNVESGQTVTATDALFAMSDRLTVKAQVDETDIAQIKLRQGAEIVLDAYASEKIPARVDEIAFEAKTVNNVTTYVVDVLPVSTPAYMRAGMTANVTFRVSVREDAVMVPTDAVTYQDGGPSVLVRASPEAVPASRSIRVGVSDGKQIEVLEGLEPGETILAVQVQGKSSGSSRTNASPFMGGAPAPSTRSGSRRSGGGGH